MAKRSICGLDLMIARGASCDVMFNIFICLELINDYLKIGDTMKNERNIVTFSRS